MYTLKVKSRSGEIVFSDLVFNEDEQLEFNYANVKDTFLSDYRFVFDEAKGTIELRREEKEPVFFTLEEHQVNELKEIKKEARGGIINFYKRILTGDEKLLFLPTGLEGYPYIITSPTIIKTEIQSPKYNNALLYVFSQKVLKARKKRTFEISNLEELHRILGKEIEDRKIAPNFDFEGSMVICMTWEEVVG